MRFRPGPLAALLALSTLCSGAARAAVPTPPVPSARVCALDSLYRIRGTTPFPDALRKVTRALWVRDFAAAESLGRALLADVRRERPDSAQAAIAATALAEALAASSDTARWSEAERLAAQAMTILERTRGADHPAFTYPLSAFGNVQLKRRDKAGALATFERVLAIRERTLPPKHPDLARALDEVAWVIAMTDYARSRELSARSVAINLAVYGPDHDATAYSRHNLALACWRMGDHREAARLESLVVVVFARSGADRPQVFKSRMLQAMFLNDGGAWGDAKILYEANIAAIERLHAEKNEDYAYAENINQLGLLLQKLGDYEQALKMSEHYLALEAEAGDPSAQGAANHALLLQRMGNHRGAREFYERALRIDIEQMGPEHEYVAEDLLGIASAYSSLGQLDSARALGERSVAIYRKLGPTHPKLAEALNSLGQIVAGQGDHSTAKGLFEEAFRITAQVWSPEHPASVLNRRGVAASDAALGERDSAFALARVVEESGRENVRLMMRFLPERQALKMAAERAFGPDLMLGLALEGGNAPERRDSYDAVIRARAMVLDEMARRHRLPAATAEESLGFAALRRARERLSNLLVRGAAGQPQEAYRESVQVAVARREAAETWLAERSAAFRREHREDHIGLAEVERALPAGACLVSYVCAPRLNLRAGATNAQDYAPAYCAFVLREGRPAPEIVDLGPASRLDSLVTLWRSHAGQPVEAARGVEGEAACRRAGERLRRAMWDPVAPLIEGASRVFVVPDGALHLVNVTALPAPAGGYLIESATILHRLVTERDLALSESRPDRPLRLLALGAPLFDAAAQGPVAASSAAFRGERALCWDAARTRFAALPATEFEVSEIGRIWRSSDAGLMRAGRGRPIATVLTGARASEEAVKALAPGVEALHVATHGFFIGNDCERQVRQRAGARPTLEASENPLLFSGLALAGANRAPARSGREDGVLTAEEIAALDFSSLQWAVLSACETGVGETTSGEGVLGLQRAFQIAGARTVVMSLWPVEDNAARAWMQALYRAHLLERRDTAESARAASLAVYQQRLRHGAGTHPFYWAGFVAAGDWH